MDKYCKAVYKIICLEACREQGISDGLGYIKIKKIDIARVLKIDRNTVARKIRLLMDQGLLSREDKYFRVDIPEEFENCDVDEKFTEIVKELKG